MKWPWVSRAWCEALQARLDVVLAERNALEREVATYKQRKPRTRKPPKVAGNGITVEGEGGVTITNSYIEGPKPKKGSPADVITKAIRSVAGDDKPLARHLRAVADARLRDEVPIRDIVREIHDGQEVRV